MPLRVTTAVKVMADAYTAVRHNPATRNRVNAMTRREFLAACAAPHSWRRRSSPEQPGQSRHLPAIGDQVGAADVTLRIGEITLDVGFGRSVRTLAYDGQVPGPPLRARVGRPRPSRCGTTAASRISSIGMASISRRRWMARTK